LKGLKSSNKISKRNNALLRLGLLGLLLLIILNFLFSFFPLLYDAIYLNGIFQIVRVFHDFSFGLLPIPSLYLFVPGMIFIFFWDSFNSWKNFLISLTGFLLWVVNLFYLLWAFNYHQPRLKNVLDLSTAQPDSIYISTAFEAQTAKLGLMVYALEDSWDLDYYEKQIRESQESLLSSWSIPTLGRVRVRKIIPGSLLHFRTTGIYIPHAIEGHIDAGLYHVQHPFTMAHEMAHGYGITDESECNFIAYLSCLAVDDPNIKFSAELAYWRYLASYYSRLHRDDWKTVYSCLDPQLRFHLEKIREYVNRYKNWMPNYRDKIYDRYLKSHGVSAGISSYDEMIFLIKAYSEKQEAF